MLKLIKLLPILIVTLLIGCSNNETSEPIQSCLTENYFLGNSSRNFNMGFSTWSFGPNLQDVNNTYQFISDNSDIYSEHIDNKIPWNSWINNLPLPLEFTNEITGRVSRKIVNQQLVLSVSLLNSNRSDLAEDFDGTIPSYTNLNDEAIENAYFKHVQFLIEAFTPNYLVIAIEVNELKLASNSKWEAYKLLINNVKTRIKTIYPNLKISESISLHNVYQPVTSNPDEYTNEIIDYMNAQDFVTISFYPFFKDLHSKNEFQQVFDFLHSKIMKPIAFVETSTLAEDLIVPNFNLLIEGNECEQNAYLETLLTNAQNTNYEFVIWWAHKDYDALWLTFPNEFKDLGQLWRDTGLLDENGIERPSFSTWKTVFNK